MILVSPVASFLFSNLTSSGYEVGKTGLSALFAEADDSEEKEDGLDARSTCGFETVIPTSFSTFDGGSKPLIKRLA